MDHCVIEKTKVTGAKQFCDLRQRSFALENELFNQQMGNLVISAELEGSGCPQSGPVPLGMEPYVVPMLRTCSVAPLC